jgi:UDP-arabinose 4-epimerase
MDSILLTGGAGYIGSHSAKRLAARGLLPVVVDDLSLGHRESVKWGPLETGSLGDAAFLRAVMEKHRPQAVMHFAAHAYVGESVTDPAKYYRNNVANTLTLLESMRAAGVGNFVFSSSCATYGVPARIPITEDLPQEPVNPYGRTKLMVERMLEDFDRAYGLKSACLRYFNAAGADPDGEIGEDHEPETHLIPLALDAAAGRREALEVYGTDYPTPDGTCIRDYIHVTDLAQAHHQALLHLTGGGDSLRLNLGNGNGYSVKDVIRTVEEVTGRPVPVRYSPRRPGDPPALVGSHAEAARVLGWRPEFGSLRDIIRTAWDWHRRLHGPPA